mmetsp:Transcript_17456/g.26904  ORF Transcript_17456/g.26904 Transcript_17456/m.26904 type:complete len:110 (+) Transcript_17456:2799-3128(+)
MDEMRCERKILMALDDDIIDDYIHCDMSELNIYKIDKDKIAKEIQNCIRDKLEFREQFSEKVSLTKLNFMFKVLRHLFKNKASIADPSCYRDKVKQFERANAVKQELKR